MLFNLGNCITNYSSIVSSDTFSLFNPVGPMLPTERLTQCRYCDVIVFLGSPELDCAGHGVCRVFPPSMSEMRNRPCPNGLMRLEVTRTGEIRLAFAKESFKKSIWAQHFRDNIFRVDSAFSFPKFVFRRLGMTAGQIILLPGDYRCVDTGKDWVIVF